MSDDILQQLANDARRLRVARKLPPTDQPLTQHDIADVQGDFTRFLTVTGLTVADVARRAGKGFSSGTLSTWRNFDFNGRHDFKGDAERIARGLNTFMENYARQMTAPRPAGFVQTKVAADILATIRQVVALQGMGLIMSDSGRGKTMTFKAAAEVITGSLYIRVKRAYRSPAGLAEMIMAELRLSRKTAARRTLRENQARIIEALRGAGRLIIVDEAHQLSGEALEFLRDLHDECETPIVLGGTRKLDDQTSDPEIFFGQLESRIALRYDVNNHARSSGDPESDPDRPLHTIEDIKAIFGSGDLKLTQDGFDALVDLANVEGFGGLRLCVQVVRVAAAASASSGKPIDRAMLLRVLRDMHGKVRAVKRIEHAISRSRVKARVA